LLKCIGCRQKYRWHANPGWVAVNEDD
jgi:hypothetical protein